MAQPDNNPTNECLNTLSEEEKQSVQQEFRIAEGLQKIEKTGTDIIFGQVFLKRSQENGEEVYSFTFSHNKDRVYLGRSLEACGPHSILIDDEQVSEKHASIFWQDGVLYIQDEGATNGTFLADKCLESHVPYELEDNSEISIGTITLECSIKNLAQRKLSQDFKAPENSMSQGVVIGEFDLINIDSPTNYSTRCEIYNDKLHFVVGRAPHCDYRIKFKEKYVADEQAQIVYSVEDSMYIVRSLNRENPVFVNGERVQKDHFLKTGDVIKLGVASNAPKVCFAIPGEIQQIKEAKKLSNLLEKLERGKTYKIGKDCEISVDLPSVGGQIATLQVPEEGEDLIISKVSDSIKIAIEQTEVHSQENRVLKPQQNLQIGSGFSITHDHRNFVNPRTPQKHLFSDFVRIPERGMIYNAGSSNQATFCIEDDSLPPHIIEIQVPNEGENFLVKKISGRDVEVWIDSELVQDYHGASYGVNQILKIGDYMEIRNDHRSLPAPSHSFLLRRILVGIFFCLFVAVVVVATVALLDKYSLFLEKSQKQQSVQDLMKTYQKNVFYVVAFDPKMENVSSGTGFLITQKDAYENNTYYIVTSKHIIEPWKFDEHQRDEAGNFFDNKGNKIENYYIAVWPFNSEAIEVKSQKRLFQNSFNNLPIREKLGEVSIHKIGSDDYPEKSADQVVLAHKKRSNQDLAILKITPKEKWDYPYQEWSVVESPQIDVGEPVIVLGYSLGGGRIINKNGYVLPAVCEGKMTSDCKFPDFLELDVSQTQGSSGGPIINHKGEIIGIVAFMDHKENLLYGIHAKQLEELMR